MRQNTVLYLKIGRTQTLRSRSLVGGPAVGKTLRGQGLSEGSPCAILAHKPCAKKNKPCATPCANLAQRLAQPCARPDGSRGPWFRPADACKFHYKSLGLGQLCPDQQMSTHKARILLYFTGPQRILLLLIDTRKPCANLARLQPDTFLESCAGCPILGSLRLAPKNGKPCAARSSVPDLKVQHSMIRYDHNIT